jgi:hypothetical protein
MIRVIMSMTPGVNKLIEINFSSEFGVEMLFCLPTFIFFKCMASIMV